MIERSASPSDDETPPPISGPASPEIVDIDAYCVECSYNLRSLSVAALCPECGTPVDRSLRGFLLRYSSLKHLRRMRLGLSLILWSIIGTILATIVFIAVASLWTYFTSTTGPPGPPNQTPTPPTQSNGVVLLITTGLMGLLFPAMYVLGLFGWWKFTEPDPSLATESRKYGARKTIRWSVATMGVAAALNLVVSYVIPLVAMSAGLSLIMALSMLGSVATFVAALVLYFASLIHMRWIGRRLENERVQKRAKRMMWLGPVVGVLGSCLIYIGPLIVLVMYTNLMYWIRKDISNIIASRAEDDDLNAMRPAATAELQR